MPPILAAIATIAGALDAAAAAVGAFVGTAVGGGAIGAAIGTAVYNGVFYGVVLGGLAGLQLILRPGIPKPDATDRALKQPITSRWRGYGTRRLYGATMLYETAEGVNYTVVAMADGVSAELVQVYLNDDQVTLVSDVVQEGADGRYGGDKIRVLYRLGAATETVYAEVVAGLPGIWTDDHRGDGITSAAIICQPAKAEDFQKVYPNFLPQLSMVFRLAPVWDPRATGQAHDDPDSWTWSDNAALHYLDFLLNDRGVDYATEIEPALSYWTDAADACDDAIALKAGGTEPRYRGGVLYQSADDPANVHAELLACFDGWCARGADGAYIVFAGKYVAPAVSLGADEILSFHIQHFQTDEAALNELQLQYISADHDYATVDASSWRDADDISTRGAVRSQQMTLQVPSHAQIGRIAKAHMARANAPFSGSCSTNSGGRAARGQRWINLTLEEGGVSFFDGVVEITKLTRNFATGGIDFEWVSFDPATYDWIAATEEPDPAPVGDRVAPEPLTTPEITDVTPFFEAATTGGQGVRLTIEVDAPDRPDLSWFARWRVNGATVWNTSAYPDIDPGVSITLETGFVSADATLDVEVAYAVADGRTSDWSDNFPTDTTTAGVAPGSPSITSHAGAAGTYSIGWQNPASTNFYGARVWKAATGAGFGSAANVGSLRLGPPNSADSYAPTGIAAGTYDLWVTAENASAAQSPEAGPVTVTVT